MVSAEAQLLPDSSVAPWGPFNLSPHPSVVNPILTASHVTDVSASFVADPFLFFENGMWYMFFEVLTGSGLGQIGMATSTDGLSWTYDRIVLSESFHLSYPFVFKYNGTYYMIPETNGVQQARLYSTSTFPYGWTHHATLISGRDILDPSLIRYNNTWWMFFANPGTSTHTYLYYSDNLTSGWTEHPMSPIVSGDRSKARPAGRPFIYNGNTLVRLAQKNNVTYGEAVRAFQVDTLTKAQYAEHEITQSPLLTASGTGWNSNGMHTLDPWWTGSDWLCAVDGKDTNDKWSIGMYRVLTNQLTVQKAGTGQGTVTSLLAAIDCGSACNVSLPQGAVVNLTATPDYGSALSGWTGCDSVSGNTCTLTLGSDRSVTADFDLMYKDLAIQKYGAGHGTVTSFPEAIDCGSICNASLPQGTVINLTTTPDYGSAFSGWTGCDSVDGNTCTFTLGSDRSVTADFRVVTEVKLLSPNGGEIIPAGLPQYSITWETPREAVKFTLSYSPGRKIAKVGPVSSTIWSVPLVTKNKASYRVHIKAYDSRNKKIGYNQSEHEFSIEVARITKPSLGNVCTSGQICTIRWTRSEYIPVTFIELSYSLNAGRTWTKIPDILSQSANSFDWVTPLTDMSYTRCKIRVVLKNSNGRKIGSVVSDGEFTIQP
jgi:hypothetical protein